MQKITLIGGVGREPKSYNSQSGNEFISFSLAASSNIKNIEKTTWYDIIIPSYLLPRYKKMSEYFKKGTPLCIIGNLDIALDTITPKGTTEKRTIVRSTVQVESIDFVSSGRKNDQSSQSAAPASQKEIEEAYTSDNSGQPVISAPAPQATPTPAPNPVAGGASIDDDELPF